MFKEPVDAEGYHDHMESIDPEIMNRVLSLTKGYGNAVFNENDVKNAIAKDHLGLDDFAALLSPSASGHLEDIAQRAKEETFKHFGNSVSIFTPLYTSNHCENGCLYCGFKKDNRIHRARLSLEEVDTEMRKISESGLTEILILTGESRSASDVGYIGECANIATRYFRSIGVEVYPLNSNEYRHLHEQGVDYVTVFQETYDPVIYEELHPFGPKRIFSYRFNAQERALMGGMRGVSFGALLGLGNFRKDVFACGLHAYFIQRKYPHAEISFSLPRLRPYINGRYDVETVSERDLLQVSLAYRLFMPFAGQTISSRESPKFRDNIVGLSATRISAGVSVGIGGHAEEKKGDEQFDISDPRDVDEIRKALVKKGLQPVFNDYVRV